VSEPAARTALNAICPYFTMFPLEFPLRVLRRARRGQWVLDPFSGRGTTTYAARLLGLPSVGIDSSPVATALTEAKLADVEPADIVRAASRILARAEQVPVPGGPFWQLAYAPDVLTHLCQLRESLLRDSRSDARKALRGIILGALHGPVNKGAKTYFSNQCPRTYAPKPRYATTFWQTRGLHAPSVDVLEIIQRRAAWHYEAQPPAEGYVIRADSRSPKTFERLGSTRPSWIITSPPYYGMKTYIPDQWLRNWFLGGPPQVEYSYRRQLEHRTPEGFADELRKVWQNVACAASSDARMVVRFGGIADRKAEPLEIARASFTGSGWRITKTRDAGSADHGRRQALLFAPRQASARSEFDIWLTRVE
jgi:DNA methylase